MTFLMKQALRSLTALPARHQNRAARRVLDLPELAMGDNETPSLLSILSEKSNTTRSKAEIDRNLDRLRDEWDS